MDETPEVTRTVERDPITGATREVRTVHERKGSATPWVVAGLVAVVAIIAVAMMTNRTGADQAQTDAQIAAAAEQARAQGMMEGAQSVVTSAGVAAQNSANQAAINAQAAADATNRQAQQAAADAQAAAERARSASDNATDAAARATTPASPDTETVPQ